jgi:NitT/TauT family transport system substrate-binding protein
MKVQSSKEKKPMLARIFGTVAIALSLATSAAAQETTIKFTLGWKTQGSDAAFFYAKDHGFFKEEGLNVIIDQGEGSGATVTRIMSGAYDAGFGDVNAIIQNASTRLPESPVMVYMMWNRPPFAIVTKATSGINTVKDFEGRTLGGAQGTPTTRLLPVFVHKNGIDKDKIKISNMAPNLQEPMLIKGDIDAALVFNITSYFNLVLNRQDPDKDFKWFSFGDFGLDLYSNGLMVSKKLIASNPKAVAGLVRATNKAMIAIAKDQNAGMKAAMNYDNLINEAVEKRRLQYSFDKLIVSPEMKEIGIGDIKDDRMTRAIAMVAEGYQLDRVPTPADVFSREFLPPRAERELVYTAN